NTFTFAHLASGGAAQSNSMTSSNMNEIRIIATNANVASQTIPVTAITSLNPTTPTTRATIAPPHADHPIDNPFGCQITEIRVIKKISDAIKTDDAKSYSPYHLHLIPLPLFSNSFNFSSCWGNRLSSFKISG